MNTVISGTVVKFGDNINTDIISPPQYMELPVAEAAKYAMSPVNAGFAAKADPNTIIADGSNFGSGSSRETSPLTLKHLGIRVIIAKSFARIFYRNGINVGLVLLECPRIDDIADGDQLTVDLKNGRIENIAKAVAYECDRVPEHIMRLIEQGGLIASLKKRFGVES